uniref:RBR-type E3 ubiquitin transferase n=1 Tax=Oreochromis aureus TaxID=47969 RepID=A0AAZ1Y4V8_OREAU
MTEDLEEQEDELLALQSIFDADEFVRDESKSAGEIRVCVELPAGFSVALREGESLRQYDISFLPPLLLNFGLPGDYPSSSPPSFSLTCSWLTRTQLAALCAHLGDLYEATGGAVVLFSWVQFLREDALRFLNIHSKLDLPPDERSTLHYNQDQHDAEPSGPKNNSEPEFSVPSSEVQENPSDGSCTDSQGTLLSHILIYNAAQKQKVFATTVFDCGVCFMGRLGSECVKLSPCGHVFCRACLCKFCTVQITEGNVRVSPVLRQTALVLYTPAQVQSLVGEKLFDRYDRLLLQNTLDSMSDVTYCPRTSCGSAVILEKSSKAALCSACGFAFCVICRKTYHGTGKCETKKKYPERYIIDLGSRERKRLLENRYGCNLLVSIMENKLSNNWIANNSKSCPECFSRIEKDGGCDRMMCTRCKRIFCWNCLTRLTPENTTEHFYGGQCSS